MSIHSTVNAKEQYPPKRTQTPQAKSSTTEPSSNAGIGRPHEGGASDLTLVERVSADTEVNLTYEMYGSHNLQKTVIQSKLGQVAGDYGEESGARLRDQTSLSVEQITGESGAMNKISADCYLQHNRAGGSGDSPGSDSTKIRAEKRDAIAALQKENQSRTTARAAQVEARRLYAEEEAAKDAAYQATRKIYAEEEAAKEAVYQANREEKRLAKKDQDFEEERAERAEEALEAERLSALSAELLQDTAPFPDGPALDLLPASIEDGPALDLLPASIEDDPDYSFQGERLIEAHSRDLEKYKQSLESVQKEKYKQTPLTRRRP